MNMAVIAKVFMEKTNNETIEDKNFMELKKKDLIEWEVADWIQLVNIMVAEEYEICPSLEKGIFILHKHQIRIWDQLFKFCTFTCINPALIR